MNQRELGGFNYKYIQHWQEHRSSSEALITKGLAAISSRVSGPSRGSFKSHQSITWVSSNRRISC